MSRKVISTDQAPAAIGPYSQAVQAGNMVFLSGQIPLSAKSGDMVGGDDVELQTDQVMKNLRSVLKAAGTGFEHVVRATIYLTDLGDFSRVNMIYGGFFSGMEPPARACVEVSALPKGAKVEIDMIALVP